MMKKLFLTTAFAICGFLQAPVFSSADLNDGIDEEEALQRALKNSEMTYNQELEQIINNSHLKSLTSTFNEVDLQQSFLSPQKSLLSMHEQVSTKWQSLLHNVDEKKSFTSINNNTFSTLKLEYEQAVSLFKSTALKSLIILSEEQSIKLQNFYLDKMEYFIQDSIQALFLADKILKSSTTETTAKYKRLNTIYEEFLKLGVKMRQDFKPEIVIENNTDFKPDPSKSLKIADEPQPEKHFTSNALKSENMTEYKKLEKKIFDMSQPCITSVNDFIGKLQTFHNYSTNLRGKNILNSDVFIYCSRSLQDLRMGLVKAKQRPTPVFNRIHDNFETVIDNIVVDIELMIKQVNKAYTTFLDTSEEKVLMRKFTVVSIELEENLKTMEQKIKAFGELTF